ncbi:hypothetical protein RJ492_005531 [Pluralibacter gergoviae]|uniref:Uncharacterized protein n=1 Tax=Pluralibacter gergoviae TaxID=61647 RepID=A0A0J5MSA0_PLUGE|nr:hypothetical protein [Pluralibacter gergoviae]EKV0918320.1 hypothetical protein [Pluralibacter gergoviae]EKV9911214.1 hypothetical protein [Pluralibacter gergoviae]EKW7277144.1 hypothetical protein [Pluralibacter gergoviae]ELD4298651.1 hypothetical protein [Pluralibacter gergoviae]ELD4309423.1 hypothetical protein [Pluralibacter gergoviae]
MSNLLRRKKLIVDGLDDSFLKEGVSIQCPLCECYINFGLYNSIDFDKIDDDIKFKMLNEMTGVKLCGEEIKEYKYKGGVLRVSKSKCHKGGESFFVVFTYNEVQPGKYESYLIGLFRIDAI